MNESENAEEKIALIEEIIKMSDEEFEILRIASLKKHGELAAEKLWLIRSEVKTL